MFDVGKSPSVTFNAHEFLQARKPRVVILAQLYIDSSWRNSPDLRPTPREDIALRANGKSTVAIVSLVIFP